VIEPGEDVTEVALSLIGPKSKATLLTIEHYVGAQWPTAVYRGTKHQLGAIRAKADGNPVGRPRKVRA
jgi:hypothetical protein